MASKRIGAEEFAKAMADRVKGYIKASRNEGWSLRRTEREWYDGFSEYLDGFRAAMKKFGEAGEN